MIEIGLVPQGLRIEYVWIWAIVHTFLYTRGASKIQCPVHDTYRVGTKSTTPASKSFPQLVKIVLVWFVLIFFACLHGRVVAVFQNFVELGLPS